MFGKFLSWFLRFYQFLSMSVAMDRALMALTLEEEEEPFIMPDLPEFTSVEENRLSLMGRILNPDYQRMPGLIITMPRKWGKEGKVRGVALSQERFQFIFQTEHDLLDVLEKGVHTYKEWVIVLERWVENPPDDYLQFIPLWVRISNIPVNYYTTGALTTLGDMVGKVIVVAFDPTKAITQDFVRVQVRFNVAHPLRMARVLNVKGKEVTIHFNYERVQKRCHECQCLNHEKPKCPLMIKKRQDEAQARRQKVMERLPIDVGKLNLEDPLYGVLEETQMGIDPGSGRPKIAKEVLDEMRRYMMADTGEDRAIKVDKLRTTVREAEADPVAQRSVLRLETVPIITRDLNKGKGPVFEYGDKVQKRVEFDLNVNPNKLMAGAFKAFNSYSVTSAPLLLLGSEASDESSVASEQRTPSVSSTVFRAGSLEPGISGTIRRRFAPRRRPPKGVRKANAAISKIKNQEDLEDRREGKQEIGSRKRKKVEQEDGGRSTMKAQCLKAVPNEGQPNPQ